MNFPHLSLRASDLCRRAFLCWQGAGYTSFGMACRQIAAHARLGVAHAVAPHWARAAVLLTRALYTLPPSTTARTVYSGLGRTAGAVLEKMPCAGTMSLDAPMSTSKFRDIAQRFVNKAKGSPERYMLEIELPVGVRALDFDHYGASNGYCEAEILLPPGTRLELTGEQYDVVHDISDEFDDEVELVTITVVCARVVGQRVPQWARTAEGQRTSVRR